MKTMTLTQAIEYIENSESFDTFSFRGDSYVPKSKFRPSRYHGDHTGIPSAIGGVSAVKIAARCEPYITDAAEAARMYGSNLYLLAGDAVSTDYGDPGEIVMTSHRIVARIVG